MEASLEDFRTRARTKIVATVGPACREEAQLAELIRTGADVFRINMAHNGTEEAGETVARIRRVSEELDEPVGILADLAGPKIRLGELPDGKIDCQLGDMFDFVSGVVSNSPTELTSTYPPLIDELSVGNIVVLADGTVGMMVEEKLPGRARCRVVQRGIIRSRQGINLPGVVLSVPTLGPHDIENAIWAAKAGLDFISLSFVRSADDVRQLRQLVAAYNSRAWIVAKIEKLEALRDLQAIVEAADAVMVARGDLGVEMDVAEMPMEQKRIIAMCRRYHRPVIIATQMLDSMHHSPRPTRAETTDVANAIMDGGDACMLSGETAIGEYPREAVEMMNRIALATETHLAHRPPQENLGASIRGLHFVTQGVVAGAGTIAHTLRAKLIVVASRSGATALALASQRNFVPIVGVSDNQNTLRQMSLYWGVTPLRSAPTDLPALAHFAEKWGLENQYLHADDYIVLVGGVHAGAGIHDVVMVHRVGEKR